VANYQDLRDAIARVVGGTAPDPANKPRWFSGVEVGDGSGVANVIGCYSAAQAQISVAGGGQVGNAVGMVLNGPGNLHYPASTDSLGPSQEYSFDNLRLLVLIPRSDPETEDAMITPFRDTIPAAFRAHTTLFNLVNVNQAAPTNWRPIAMVYGSGKFIGWDFTLRVFRTTTVTYSLG
jgi:hypothetical protein